MGSISKFHRPPIYRVTPCIQLSRYTRGAIGPLTYKAAERILFFTPSLGRRRNESISQAHFLEAFSYENTQNCVVLQTLLSWFLCSLKEIAFTYRVKTAVLGGCFSKNIFKFVYLHNSVCDFLFAIH